MSRQFAKQVLLLLTALLIHSTVSHAEQVKCNKWQLNESQLTARHESAAVPHGEYIYLLGGRGIKAVERFDPNTKSWMQTSPKTPVELHHFQPVVWQNKIYILGAFTGRYPNETTIENVLIYDTQQHQFSNGPALPKDRLRGAAGAVVHNEKIYLIGGIINGHMSGSVRWFDEFDPKTNTFKKLPDAPIARDHFYTVVVDNKLYVIGGRKSSAATGQVFDLTIAEVDVYDFANKKWQTLPASANIPTPRAGANVEVVGKQIWVMGGESGAIKTAHAEVEVFDTVSQSWSRISNLNVGRHSGGSATLRDKLYIFTGSGNRGGRPELRNYESMDISEKYCATKSPVHKTTLFKTIDIDLEGPNVSENDGINPFTDYVLWTQFTHESGKQWHIRGYFAADGKAAMSSADSGNMWRSKFTPSLRGKYTFKSTLFKGKNAAITSYTEASKSLNMIKRKLGTLSVSKKQKTAKGFLHSGFMKAKNGFFYFPHTNHYWLKGGTNSPENFLAYWEFDGTYRVSEHSRDGESKAGKNAHRFQAHIKDFKPGDPLWGGPKQAKGQGIIGAINYLAEQGVNAQYFLTMNIKGDGRDVWPYIDHSTFDRFDVSKLAQWNTVFEHMQNKGILLHFVTQETENETLLDNGDTAFFRKLYYAELIARFAHHKALVWNLGEENGPEDWTPIAQNDQQRIAMAKYFADHDPYKHPVLIHSHSTPTSKDKLLPPLLNSDYDGVSMQIHHRNQVFEEISKWRDISKQRESGESWLLSMDEIGTWYTGTKIDADDPNHDTLRQHVLWPSFLAGGAGVEWYFGGRQPQNDLNTEDFRTRESLWRMTLIARQFLQENKVPLWDLTAQAPIYDSTLVIDGLDDAPSITLPAASVYQANNGKYFIAYAIAQSELSISMPFGNYKQIWLDPIAGDQIEKDTLTINTKDYSMTLSDDSIKRDWVILLIKID